MSTLISKKEPLLTAIMVGSKVTFIGNLPGGYFDNYSGYSKRGNVFGTVTKIGKTNSKVVTRDGDLYRVPNTDIINIEDLF